MKTIHLTYPESWEEVGKKDLKIIAKTLLLRLSRREVLFILFCRLSRICLLPIPGVNEQTAESVYYFKKGYQRFSLKAETICQACKNLEFILDSYGLPACPLPGINPKLYDIPFKVYFFADALFSRYLLTRQRSYLKESIRALTGKKKVKSTWLDAYVIWFSGLQNFLKEKYKNLFTESDVEDLGDKSPADVLGEILSAINKDEPQNNAKILESETHSVLLALDNIYYKVKHAYTGFHK